MEAFFVTLEHHAGTAFLCALFCVVLAMSLRGRWPW